MYAWFETIYMPFSILIWFNGNSEEKQLHSMNREAEGDKHISRLANKRETELTTEHKRSTFTGL